MKRVGDERCGEGGDVRRAASAGAEHPGRRIGGGAQGLVGPHDDVLDEVARDGEDTGRR